MTMKTGNVGTAPEDRAPGGIMLPNFYNELGAMHGTIMVFLGVGPHARAALVRTAALIAREELQHLRQRPHAGASALQKGG